MADRDDLLYHALVKRKDTAGDFYYLRRDSVDVMRYLPRFLAKDPDFLKIQNALSWEHERLRLKVVDIARQFYVETATWGLSSWEKIYEVTPPKNADYTLRRALVKAKMLGSGVMTVQAIKRLVNPFLFEPDADIDELPVPGTFRVLIHSGTDYMSEIRRALAVMSPAHLVYKFRFVIEDLLDDESVNLSDVLSVTLNLGYEDAYPYESLTFLRDGSLFHEGVLHRDGLFLHNGAILRCGTPLNCSFRSGKYINIDALSLVLNTILYDDVSRYDDDVLHNGIFTRNGTLFRNSPFYREGIFSHNGTLARGRTVGQTLTLPLELLSYIGVRPALKDTVRIATDSPTNARLSLTLRDFVPYGTRLQPLLHNGDACRSATLYRNGTLDRQNVTLHDGNTLSAQARLGRSDLDMDEYMAKVVLALRDDVSELVLRRNGEFLHEGKFRHGAGVLPMELEHRIALRQVLRETVEQADDKRLAAEISARLFDIVPYGTKPLAQHDGNDYRGGTFIVMALSHTAAKSCITAVLELWQGEAAKATSLWTNIWQRYSPFSVTMFLPLTLCETAEQNTKGGIYTGRQSCLWTCAVPFLFALT